MTDTIVTDHPLRQTSPPPWASSWGHDAFGPWCELSVGDAVQRFRWIPPGQFQMGSPASEGGRFDDEGPLQWVKLTQGFWLFDIPCTQSFWSAVTGVNPSHFEGSDRPIENVSWDDCQEFCNRLNSEYADLNLRLPTEAEWEYACRAGSREARYAELSEVAWYNDNSENSTHDVMLKEANSWGLYDMLGNVWEWCQDPAYRAYKDEAAVDPFLVANDSPGDDSRAVRVVRGGSWSLGALNVRAAFRSADPPENRYGGLGFRCLSSPVPASPAMRR